MRTADLALRQVVISAHLSTRNEFVKLWNGRSPVQVLALMVLRGLS